MDTHILLNAANAAYLIKRMRKILVFGVFDGLHKGHLFFLKQAKVYGDYLIVALARDLTVQRLKERVPVYDEKSRRASLLASGIVDKVYFGDKVLGRYSIIRKTKPDVIVLGYDQDELHKNLNDFLNKRGLPIKVVKVSASFKPNKYHSKIINTKLISGI